MKYIRKFATHAEYEIEKGKGNLILPNVSYCEDGGDVVHYNPWDDNDYEYVDLGLSVLWASKNVGAPTVNDYGSFFSWGNSTPYNLGDDSYIFGQSSYSGTSGYTLQDNIPLYSNYDMVNANMGGSWRLPTNDEINELLGELIWSHELINNITFLVGYSNTTKKSIYFPCAGLIYENPKNPNHNKHKDYDGDDDPERYPRVWIWGGEIYSSDKTQSTCIEGFPYGDETEIGKQYNHRFYGLQIRGVLPKNYGL